MCKSPTMNKPPDLHHLHQMQSCPCRKRWRKLVNKGLWKICKCSSLCIMSQFQENQAVNLFSVQFQTALSWLFTAVAFQRRWHFVSSKSEARRKKFLNLEIQTLCNHFETTSHRVHCKQPAIFSYFSSIFSCSWLFEVACGFHTCGAREDVHVVNKSNASKTFVAFRCNHCKGEYRTQRAYDCHRWYPSTLRKPCSDARNQRLITFTQRQDLATGILQEHAVSYFGNICHNAYCNGMNDELHFHYISCT